MIVEHCRTLQAGNWYFGVELSANAVIDKNFQDHVLPKHGFEWLLRTIAGQVCRLVGPSAIVQRKFLAISHSTGRKLGTSNGEPPSWDSL